MMEEIQFLSEKIKKVGFDYVHVFFEEKHELFTTLNNGGLSEKTRFVKGISILVYKDNRSSFVATNDLTSEGLQRLTQRASEKIGLGIVAPKLSVNLIDDNLTYKLNNYHLQLMEEKFNNKILSSEVVRKKIISNSGEIPVSETIHYGSVISEILSEEHLFERCIGWVNNQSNLISTMKKVDSNVTKVYKNYQQPTKRLKDGIYPILFGNMASGMLFHEILHLFEKRDNHHSVNLTDINNDLTIYSNPSDSNKFGSYIFDDEGYKSQEVCIVEKGIVKNLIINSKQDYELNVGNGHGRREDFRYRPRSRMSNIKVVNGNYSHNQILSNMRDGIYVQKIRAGNANHKTQQIQLKVEEAFEIKNGYIVQPLASFYITGSIHDYLRRIELIGNDEITISISCKGSSGVIPVSLTQPSVLVNGLAILN